MRSLLGDSGSDCTVLSTCFLRDSLPSLGMSSLRGLMNGNYLTTYLDNFNSFLIASYRIPPAPL